MYMNAFRNNRTTFHGPTGVEPSTDRNTYGWIDFLEAVDESGYDLMPGMKYIAPDDGNPYDMTVLSIKPAQPVMPGDTFRISEIGRAHV